MDTIHVTEEQLRALIGELENALERFNGNFKALETGLVGLTSKGFTGDAAETLMTKFNGTVKPNLESVRSETSKILGYMQDQLIAFNKLNADLDAEMNR